MNDYSNGTNDKFEDEIVDYYQSQQLSNDRLHSIIDSTQSRRRGFYLGFAMVASVALMSVFAMLHQFSLNSQQTGMVLREAALNHRSKLQMDAKADSLPELQTALSELPFTITLPETEFFQRLSLVGGRYCTISGNLAAHIKLTDPNTNQQYSLFLTPYAENLKSMDSPAVEISGVEVKLWRENDVVYASAAESEDS